MGLAPLDCISDEQGRRLEENITSAVPTRRAVRMFSQTLAYQVRSSHVSMTNGGKRPWRPSVISGSIGRISNGPSVSTPSGWVKPSPASGASIFQKSLASVEDYPQKPAERAPKAAGLLTGGSSFICGQRLFAR